MTFTAGFLSRNRVAVRPLAALTTFRIGGPATVVDLDERTDLSEAVAAAPRWLGRGANLLVTSQPIAQPVLRLGRDFATLAIEPRGDGALVRAGAAVDLAELITACVKAGLAGPEGLAGVPATVGGALRMNAGTTTCWMLDHVVRVEALLPGEDQPRWIERAAMPAAYRQSGLPAGSVLLGCEMDLRRDDPELLRATAARLKKAKAATQPLALPSAGCIFRNPSPSIPAGKLIDELGLKGARIGRAAVSTVHANFIVNEGRDATSEEVTALITTIRATAWRERGIDLHMEVESWDCAEELHAPASRLPMVDLKGQHAG